MNQQSEAELLRVNSSYYPFLFKSKLSFFCQFIYQFTFNVAEDPWNKLVPVIIHIIAAIKSALY